MPIKELTIMPHTDQKIKANSGLFAAIFPVQTKSITSIIIWSIILLADLVLAVVCAFHFGVISLENFSKWTVGLVPVAVLVVFWLQGVVWSAVIRLFRKK